MQSAVENTPETGMLAVIGLSVGDLVPCLSERKNDTCVIANDNGGGQIVLSGHKNALNAAAQFVKEKKARAIPLKVAGAFHSPIMSEAADKLSEALAQTTLQPPKVPVITNRQALPVTDTSSLLMDLKTQVTGTVRWRESMDTMFQFNVRNVIEWGPGRVLTGSVQARLSTDTEHKCE